MGEPDWDCADGMANVTLLLLAPTPPPAPPPAKEFYGDGGYCGSWYTRSYATDSYWSLDTGGRGAAFSKAARACLEKCMSDERCNALEMRGDACEYHTGAEVKLRPKRYQLDWPMNDEPKVVSCWIKAPLGCNRECELAQPYEIWHWFTLPAITAVDALLLALVARSCKDTRSANEPAPRPDVEAPEAAWEPPSRTMPTRIVTAGPEDVEESTSAGGSAAAMAAAAAAVAASSDDRTVPECAICLSELMAGEIVLLLPCGHEFHMPCFKGWEEVRARAKQGRPTCPLCKADLSGGKSGQSGGRQPAIPPSAEGQTGTAEPFGRQAPPISVEGEATAAIALPPTTVTVTASAAASPATSAATSSSAAAGITGGRSGRGEHGRHGDDPPHRGRSAALRHLSWAGSYLP